MSGVTTHAPKVGDKRGVTMCGSYVHTVVLEEPGLWPTCRACCDGIIGTRGMVKALGLADKGARP